MATIKNCTCFITPAVFIDCLNEITTKKEDEAKEGKKLIKYPLNTIVCISFINRAICLNLIENFKGIHLIYCR